MTEDNLVSRTQEAFRGSDDKLRELSGHAGWIVSEAYIAGFCAALEIFLPNHKDWIDNLKKSIR